MERSRTAAGQSFNISSDDIEPRLRGFALNVDDEIEVILPVKNLP